MALLVAVSSWAGSGVHRKAPSATVLRALEQLWKGRWGGQGATGTSECLSGSSQGPQQSVPHSALLMLSVAALNSL